MARYEIRDAETDGVLSQHVTLSGAMDVWRLKHAGQPVRIVRIRARGAETPVVEGVWHAGRARPSPGEDDAGSDGAPAEPDGERDALRELLDLVVETSADDWHLVPMVERTAAGTTFIGGPVPGDLQQPIRRVRHRSAVLRRDPAVALAWDFDPEPGRGTAVTTLGRGSTTTRCAEIRTFGSVVHRPTYLDFERGTVYLPVPLREEEPGTFKVPDWDMRFVSVLNELTGRTEYAAFCSRLGLVEERGHPLDRTG